MMPLWEWSQSVSVKIKLMDLPAARHLPTAKGMSSAVTTHLVCPNKRNSQ